MNDILNDLKIKKLNNLEISKTISQNQQTIIIKYRVHREYRLS